MQTRTAPSRKRKRRKIDEGVVKLEDQDEENWSDISYETDDEDDSDSEDSSNRPSSGNSDAASSDDPDDASESPREDEEEEFDEEAELQEELRGLEDDFSDTEHFIKPKENKNRLRNRKSINYSLHEQSRPLDDSEDDDISERVMIELSRNDDDGSNEGMDEQVYIQSDGEEAEPEVGNTSSTSAQDTQTSSRNHLSGENDLKLVIEHAEFLLERIKPILDDELFKELQFSYNNATRKDDRRVNFAATQHKARLDIVVGSLAVNLCEHIKNGHPGPFDNARTQKVRTLCKTDRTAEIKKLLIPILKTLDQQDLLTLIE